MEKPSFLNKISTFASMNKLLLILTSILLASCATTKSDYVATTGGGHIYYEERGKGEPLLLLHGHSLDRRMWNCQWQAFAKHYRVVRMDFRGYGRSSEQREDLQMTHADDVITLMDSLHIQKAHIVGLSMGSFVTGDLLAMFPERLLTCVMASGGIRNSKGPSEPMDSAESAKRDLEIAILKEKGVERMKAEWTEQLISGGGSRRERIRKPLTQMIKDWTAWQPLHKEVRLFYGKEAWAKLRERGKTAVPTLFVRGACELKGKRGNPKEMDYLTNAKFVVIDDCGHMLNMERPKEFNHTVLDFMEGGSKGKD
jgi:pimeloyl-ACP methyl ester carboxylesterase